MSSTPSRSVAHQDSFDSWAISEESIPSTSIANQSSPSSHLGSPGNITSRSTSIASRSSSSSAFSWVLPTSRRSPENSSQKVVVGIEVIKRNGWEGNAYDPNKLLTGDVVKSVKIEAGGLNIASAPSKKVLFKSLKAGFPNGPKDRHIKLIIEAERRGCVMPGKEAKFVDSETLQDWVDQSHCFTFKDYSSLEECMKLQEKQHERMKIKALSVKCESLKPSDHLQINTCYSMVVAPQRLRSDNMDETVLQAMCWFNASQSSKVPLIFLNIQVEPFVLELEQRSANNVLSSVTSAGTYVLQQSDRAACLNVVRAIRVWYRFEFSELQVNLEARDGETRLGVKIEQTEHGFCHVTEADEADEHTAAHRAHLHRYLRKARDLGKLLLVTRVGNEKVLPWFISDGEVSCFDVNSIRAKLAAYRDARSPAFIHIVAEPITEEAIHSSPISCYHFP